MFVTVDLLYKTQEKREKKREWFGQLLDTK
jgi:hypothetical protein